MPKTQLDFLNEERRCLSSLLSGDLVLTKSWQEPYAPTNVHVIEAGMRRLTVEITHKNSGALCQTAFRNAVKQFAAGDMDLYRLTC